MLCNLTAQETVGSLLYKVEGNGIQESYLFGTIHIMPNKDFEMKEKVSNAFKESELIVLELDMDDPMMQLEMMKHMSMKDGMTLDKLFSEKDYKLLDKELIASSGVGIAMFNSMKPFIVMSMMLTKYLGDQPASFEGTFVQMAAEQKKEIIGLETVEEQMSVFDKISYQTQADEIVELLNEEEETKKLFNDMIKRYKEEDVEGLYQLMQESHDGSEEEFDHLLHNRNENWIPKIGEMAKDKKVFFGVGAGHLGGEKGVIFLLTKAGYKVTAVE